MDTQELDDLTDDDDLTVYRARARTELDQIVTAAKQTLAEHGIDITVFFLVQSSGPILTFGTMADPSDDQWEQVSEIVLSIVREVTGLDGVWSRQVMCASTDAVAGNEHSPMPISTIMASPAGADDEIPRNYPIVAAIASGCLRRILSWLEITIDPADWSRFQQLYSDNPATRILGHDDPENGALTVYIGCASLETRRRLEDGCWG